VVAPLASFIVGLILSWLFYLPVRGDCGDPCDGPAMAGFGLALMLLWVVWLLYWPVLILWRGRTLGSRLMGLRYEGRGLRRRLAWDSKESEQPH
jgi:hypothetical protein